MGSFIPLSFSCSKPVFKIPGISKAASFSVFLQRHISTLIVAHQGSKVEFIVQKIF